jgi:starch synthase
VRRTGGLRDTVIDIGDGGFGLCHDQTSVSDAVHSIGRAIQLFADTKKFDAVRKEIQQIDHSWNSVAETYISVYQSISKQHL